jgi:hypothetical protein
MFTHEIIQSTLEAARERLLTHYQAFTPEELEATCTQSEVPDGTPWRPKDHLVHLLFAERFFQKVIKRTLAGNVDPVGISKMGLTNGEEMLNWIHRSNQRTIEAHYNDDMNHLLTELARARKDTLAQLEQLTQEQLALPVAGAALLWADGTIGGLLITNAHHEILHLSWVEKGLHASKN